jgi:hypothetical protein
MNFKLQIANCKSQVSDGLLDWVSGFNFAFFILHFAFFIRAQYGI